MNKRWIALAAEMLDLAEEAFSNHGCNDWDWPDDWTEMDRDEFLTAFREWTDDPDDERQHLPDYTVMEFLADYLRVLGQ
jgi:hypothetical protein